MQSLQSKMSNCSEKEKYILYFQGNQLYLKWNGCQNTYSVHMQTHIDTHRHFKHRHKVLLETHTHKNVLFVCFVLFVYLFVCFPHKH